VRDQVYCPNCGSLKINAFPNNAPVADFFCTSCKEEYELKSQKSIFGKKVLDGSFKTKCERLAADNNPNLFLLNYDLKDRRVHNLLVVPKHFFVRETIEERKPLADTARRAGWIVQTFCSIRSLNLGKYFSFELGNRSQRTPSSRNGSKRCFCEIKVK
jgi:type II restriction enzyme